MEKITESHSVKKIHQLIGFPLQSFVTWRLACFGMLYLLKKVEFISLLYVSLPGLFSVYCGSLQLIV